MTMATGPADMRLHVESAWFWVKFPWFLVPF